MKTWLKSTRNRGPALALALMLASVSGGLAQDQTKPSTSENAPRTAAPAPAAPAPIQLPTLMAGPPDVSAPQSSPFPSPPTRFSAWTSEIIKMAQAGIDERVMLTYIDSAGTFNLGADEIVYLRDLGISSFTIATMLQHDADIVSGARPLTMSATPAQDPAIQITFAPNTDVSGSITQPQPAATVPGLVTSEPTPSSAPVVPALPQVDPSASAPDSGAPASTPAPSVTAPSSPAKASLFAQPDRAPQTQRMIYPVRQPYPVELVAPITIAQSPPERPLNTVVIRFIP